MASVADPFSNLPHKNPFFDIKNAITYVTPLRTSYTEDSQTKKQIETIERAFQKLLDRLDLADHSDKTEPGPEECKAFMERFEDLKHSYRDGDFLQSFHEFAVLFLREHATHFSGKQIETLLSPRSGKIKFFQRRISQIDSPRIREIILQEDQSEKALLYLNGFYLISEAYLEYIEKGGEVLKIGKAIKSVIQISSPTFDTEERKEQVQIIELAYEELQARYTQREEVKLFKGFSRLATEFFKDFAPKVIDEMLSPRGRIQSFTISSPRVRQGVVLPDLSRAKQSYFKSFYFLAQEYLERIQKGLGRVSPTGTQKSQSDPNVFKN